MPYCSSCGQMVVAEAKFCNACGMILAADPTTALQPGAPPETEPGARGEAAWRDPLHTAQGRPKSKWYHNTWFVLLMLTPLALGPLALPLLWKSPAFSRRAKWWLTLGTVLWTALFLVYIMQHVVPAVMHELHQLDAIFSPL